MGPTDVVLHVRPCEGLVRQLDGTVEKRFAKTELRVPLQVLDRQRACAASELHQRILDKKRQTACSNAPVHQPQSRIPWAVQRALLSGVH